jgi:site-specific DNA-adenine methylase
MTTRDKLDEFIKSLNVKREVSVYDMREYLKLVKEIRKENAQVKKEDHKIWVLHTDGHCELL